MKGLTKKVVSVLLVMVMVLSFGACSKNNDKDTPTTAEPTVAADDQSATKDETSTPEVTEQAEDASAPSSLEPNLTDPITLRFSWWGGDTRHEATNKALDAFTAKYPNIKVEAEYGAWSGWQENIATQLAGGTEADLLQINWNWISQFSPNGDKFYDLNKLSSIISIQNYPKELLDLMSVNDSLQGVPIGTTGRVFYWNEETFKKAGLSIPTSFADIIAAGETFKTVLGDDYYPIALGEYDRILLLMYYLHQTYGKEWVVNKQVNYTVDEVKAGLDWINMLEDKHVTPTLSTIAGDGATSLDKNTKWMDGHYAGIYEWDSSAAKFQSALSEGQSFVIGQFPTDLGTNKSGFTKISMGFAVSANSKHPAEAALLLEFLTSDPEGVKIMGMERGTVSNKAAEATLVSEGLLSGLTYDANNLVMGFKGFDIDPNFEHSSLKDSTGYYYEVFQNLSYDQTDSATAAQYLIDCVNEVNAAN
jgi:oligogalacturonide transport system substrate-binding protein